MEKKYKWSHPSEWLQSFIEQHAECTEQNHLGTLKLCRDLAGLLDGDQIQDLFQSEMDADGYFTPLKNRRVG